MIWVKLLLVLFCLSSSPLVWAEDALIDLSAHGTDLKEASFPIRHRFEKKYGKDWQRSTYKQRKEFLTYWYKTKADEAKAEEMRIKEEMKEAKVRERERKTQKKHIEDLAKGEAKAVKEEHRAKKASKRNIDRAAKSMERELKRLQTADKDSRR